MTTNIAQWGNSLAVRLPKEAVERAGLRRGDPVEVEIAEGAVTLRAVRPRYRLDELLVGMTPEAMRDAFDWGPDVGREIVE